MLSENENWYTVQDVAENRKTLPNFLKYLWKHDCVPGHDVVIHLSKDGLKYKAHKYVLCCHSKYFERLLNRSDVYAAGTPTPKPILPETYWSDDGNKETQSLQNGIVEVILGAQTSITGDVMNLILKFMYTCETDEINSNSLADRTWAATEVLVMPHLQKFCVEKFGPNVCVNGRSILEGAIPPENRTYSPPQKSVDTSAAMPAAAVPPKSPTSDKPAEQAIAAGVPKPVSPLPPKPVATTEAVEGALPSSKSPIPQQAAEASNPPASPTKKKEDAKPPTPKPPSPTNKIKSPTPVAASSPAKSVSASEDEYKEDSVKSDEGSNVESSADSTASSTAASPEGAKSKTTRSASKSDAPPGGKKKGGGKKEGGKGAKTAAAADKKAGSKTPESGKSAGKKEKGAGGKGKKKK